MDDASPAERPALYRLYDTQESEGLPPFLGELYPNYLSAFHHLGTAGSCPNGGPGLSYGMWDFEDTELVRVIKWGTPQTPIPTALYRLRNSDGEPLYTGIAENPERRWKEHAADKQWWAQVAERSVEWLPTRNQALAAEANAIRTERPRHNVQHNGASVA